MAFEIVVDPRVSILLFVDDYLPGVQTKTKISLSACAHRIVYKGINFVTKNIRLPGKMIKFPHFMHKCLTLLCRHHFQI